MPKTLMEMSASFVMAQAALPSIKRCRVTGRLPRFVRGCLRLPGINVGIGSRRMGVAERSKKKILARSKMPSIVIHRQTWEQTFSVIGNLSAYRRVLTGSTGGKEAS